MCECTRQAGLSGSERALLEISVAGSSTYPRRGAESISTSRSMRGSIVCRRVILSREKKAIELHMVAVVIPEPEVKHAAFHFWATYPLPPVPRCYPRRNTISRAKVLRLSGCWDQFGLTFPGTHDRLECSMVGWHGYGTLVSALNIVQVHTRLGTNHWELGPSLGKNFEQSGLRWTF